MSITGLKKKRGQPRKKPSELKSARLSIRMTKAVKKILLEQYGSVQVFFDLCLSNNGDAEL